MRVNEELNLLIKSKYPVVVFETFDEIYTLRQLSAIAEQLSLFFYQWSLTDGLRKAGSDGSCYQTNDPVKMLQMIQYLLGATDTGKITPGLFVLKDLERHLTNDLSP